MRKNRLKRAVQVLADNEVRVNTESYMAAAVNFRSHCHNSCIILKPWGPTNLLYNGYRLFPGVKAAGAWRRPLTPSNAEVEGKVELCSLSGTWWPVTGWTSFFSAHTFSVRYQKIKGEMEVARRRGRRRKELLDDLKDRRGYSHLKEEALDRTMWRNRFGGGFGPVVRQNTE